MFNKIYNNSLYKLNFANIKLMLTTQYFAVDEQDIIHRNYTCVQGEPGSPLADYIAHKVEYIRYLQTPITNLDKVKSSKIRKIILHFGKSAE